MLKRDETARLYHGPYIERIEELEAALIMTAAHLRAAVSLLETGGKEAAWSDKVFETMIADYMRSVEQAVEVLRDGEDDG